MNADAPGSSRKAQIDAVLLATANELQFSRDNVVPFQPGGMASSREWIQINRAEAAEYEKDLQLFRASLEFVKAARTR
jgi:hypothetical protein